MKCIKKSRVESTYRGSRVKSRVLKCAFKIHIMRIQMVTYPCLPFAGVGWTVKTCLIMQPLHGPIATVTLHTAKRFKGEACPCHAGASSMWGFLRQQVPVLTLPQGHASESCHIVSTQAISSFQVMCFNASLAPYSACWQVRSKGLFPMTPERLMHSDGFRSPASNFSVQCCQVEVQSARQKGANLSCCFLQFWDVWLVLGPCHSAFEVSLRSSNLRSEQPKGPGWARASAGRHYMQN